MRYVLATISYILLAGCAQVDDVMDSLSGVKLSLVVLRSGPVELSTAPTVFQLATAAEVLGKDTSVCVVLAGNIPHEKRDAEVDRLLKGAKLSALVLTIDGTERTWECNATHWNLYGRVLPSEELSACVIPSCGNASLPTGSKVSSITISSAPALHTIGAYWESTNTFDRGN